MIILRRPFSIAELRAQGKRPSAARGAQSGPYHEPGAAYVFDMQAKGLLPENALPLYQGRICDL